MKRIERLGGAAVATLALLLACGDNSKTSSELADCNPLGGPACMMPFPTSAYLAPDDTTATGFRVEFPAAALPVNQDGIAVEPTRYSDFDGFSVSGPIIAAFETGVSAAGLPPHSDVAASMAPDASVVVVNMATGERLPIFAEPDMNASRPEERALIIRPLDRMQSETRYAVGIRKSVKAADGSELPIFPAFARVLAGQSIDHPLAGRVEPGYEAVFTALEATGVPRDDLVLAWDFVTASDETMLGDLISMRGQALPAIGETAENLTFEVSELTNDNPTVVRNFIVGTYDVPMFLTEGELDTSVLARDAAGVPSLGGMAKANMAAIVPRCVESAPLPIPVIVFGHGMFGNAEGALDFGFLQDIAERNCVVVIGGDWIGLTNRQFAAVAFAMNDINRGIGLTEKLAQALINFIALQRLARFQLGSAPEFQQGGVPIIDPDRVYYYGASLGGILGGVYMAFDPDIELGVLGVPGGPWSLLFERSTYWPPLRSAMKGAYNLDPWHYQQNIALLGMLFGKVDPVTAASRVIADPLPGTPAKRLLLYMAMGDALVTNIASEVLTRALDIPVTGPSVVEPFGVELVTDPVPNAMTIYDEGVSPWPPETNAMEGFDYNNTHGDVSELAAVQRQVFALFFEGEVRHECADGDGPAPCLCTTGACD